MNENPWLLPEGIEELLPADANVLEGLRRKLLDLYSSWGYQLVVTPFIEYLESLLIAAGHDLDIQTFKLTDQLTGRMMGVRADITPQVARIDIHRLKQEWPTRLCYMGTVLRTRSDGFGATRSPLQVGAELYGHSGPESDAEILCLMLETLKLADIKNLYIDLGHVGIYRILAQAAGLTKNQESQFFGMLQRKALPEIEEFLQASDAKPIYQDMLGELACLNGDADVLTRARSVFKKADKDVLKAIDYIEQVAALVNRRVPEVGLHYDLAELRGYHYQTGVVFAAFVPEEGQEIARGGRYDIGQAFGKLRPATGFSTDLKTLTRLMSDKPISKTCIFAPAVQDEKLIKLIDTLREQGETVICELPGQTGKAVDMGCDRILQQNGDDWIVQSL